MPPRKKNNSRKYEMLLAAKIKVKEKKVEEKLKLEEEEAKIKYDEEQLVKSEWNGMEELHLNDDFECCEYKCEEDNVAYEQDHIPSLFQSETYCDARCGDGRVIELDEDDVAQFRQYDNNQENRKFFCCCCLLNPQPICSFFHCVSSLFCQCFKLHVRFGVNRMIIVHTN